MAERTLDADRDQLVGVVEDALDADHRMRAQQGNRGLRILQADIAALDRFGQDLGQLAGVDLQSDLERLLGRQARADAALLFAEDGFMQAQLSAPELLAPEGVVAEGLAPLVQHPFGVGGDAPVEIGAGFFDFGGRIGFGRPRSGYAARGKKREGERGSEATQAHGNFLRAFSLQEECPFLEYPKLGPLPIRTWYRSRGREFCLLRRRLGDPLRDRRRIVGSKPPCRPRSPPSWYSRSARPPRAG